MAAIAKTRHRCGGGARASLSLPRQPRDIPGPPLGPAGPRSRRIEEVKRSRDEIAAAIKINPNAHYGREKYQLTAIEWIIDPPGAAGRQYLPNLLGWEPYYQSGHAVDPKLADDAVRGLAGLIVLGNAWESVDIFHALSVALRHDTVGIAEESYHEGRSGLSYLAFLRCSELIDGGKASMLPDAPRGEKLKAILPRRGFLEGDRALASAFASLRPEADAWQEARTTFMTRRLNEGRHPDTDPDFWNGYTERPAPGLPRSVPDRSERAAVSRESGPLILEIALPVFAVAAFIGVLATRSARRARTARHKLGSPRGSGDDELF